MPNRGPARAAAARRGLVRTQKAPREHDFFHPTSYRDAVCGITVKVVLSDDFDPGDQDSCQSCAAAVFDRGN